MSAAQTLTVVAMVSALLAVASATEATGKLSAHIQDMKVEPNKHSLVASDNSDHVIDTQEDFHREFGELHQIYRSHEEKLRDRGRKKSGVNPEDLYKAFTILKSVIGFLLMFVSPIVQIKGLGLQVINTVINIARFIYMVQNSQSTHHEIHLTHQPHSHDIQTVSHQTYGHDIPPTNFHTYGKDIPPAILPTYGNDIPPVSHHTFNQDIHTQGFDHANYIQPAHLQSYSYKNQEPNQHAVVSEDGPLRRYYSKLPSTSKKESYSNKMFNNTSR